MRGCKQSVSCTVASHPRAAHKKRKVWCKIQDQEPGYQPSVTSARVHVRVSRVDIDTRWVRKSCRLLLLPCSSVLLVVSMCLDVLRQFHRLHSEWGQMTNATALNAVPVLEEVCAGTTRSGACGSILTQNGKSHQVLTQKEL